nr:hypothetical protein [uncultured Glaciecola sp.]
MYSPTSIPLEPNNTVLSDNILSVYQKATLQTMGIVLYELRDPITVIDSVDVIKSPGIMESSHPFIQEPLLIDETDAFIKQLLSIFNVSSSAELGLTWQVQDSETIMLKNNILMTPDAQTLRKSNLKKQLWDTLHVFFKTQEWS